MPENDAAMRRIRVMLVDDDEDDFYLIREFLSEVEGGEFEIDWAPTYDAGMEAVERKEHDVYLFDYRLGEKNGLILLREAGSCGFNKPVIMLTGHGDHEIDMLAMKAGASDFLVKSRLDSALLERSIRYAIERNRAEERIATLAYYDSLTELPNRALFEDRLERAIALAGRHQRLSAILFIDLDNFKRINDTLGHDIGDVLLKEVAKRLKMCIRRSDSLARNFSDVAAVDATVARMGGDEFTLLLTEINNHGDTEIVSRRILDSIREPFNIEGHELFITASIGIAHYPTDGRERVTLVKNADAAMYHAKSGGKNGFRFYDREMNVRLQENYSIENDLRRALERDEFVLYYQPIVDGSSKRIVSMEALLRWRHPNRGMLSPGDFLVTAEETGLIMPIGEWVLRSACLQSVAWHRSGYERMPVSVNFSITEISRNEVIDMVKSCLAETGMDGRYLSIEITETVMSRDVDATIEILNRLNEAGIRLIMDDFGSGYSSFYYLKRIPLSCVKIDRSFIRDTATNPDCAAIVKAMIAMGHSLNLKVIAEGIETKDQSKVLEALGCDELQGFLFGRPAEAGEIEGSFMK